MASSKVRPDLSILVPVYNEEKTIQQILEGVTLLSIKKYEVIVVDDASKDKSRQIIDDFSKKLDSPNVTLEVLSHEKNRGKGAGIKTGLEHARGKYFIIQDADLEYDPADIPSLLKSAFESDRPVVYGSRFLGEVKNMPKPNYYANRFYNYLLRRLYNTAITDMHTCYKMISTDIMKELEMSSEGFDYATELISKLLRRGHEIYEVPISFNGRTRKQGKKIGLRDGIDCMYMIFKYKFSRAV